jgi:hypothetical protein
MEFPSRFNRGAANGGGGLHEGEVSGEPCDSTSMGRSDLGDISVPEAQVSLPLS